MKIGIPRAFYFHYHPEFWECFFRGIGHEPFLSPRSTRQTLEIAGPHTEPENCLPQKLFDGHLLSLLDKVDAVFVPRMIALVRGHVCCPRFGALPDATRAGIARGFPLLTIEINETIEPLAKRLLPLARALGAGGRTARRAVRDAQAAMRAHHRQTALEHLEASCTGGRFLLLGHPYTLHDPFIADPIIMKLQQLRVPVERMRFDDDTIEPGLILWCIFNKMYRKLQTLDMNAYAGVIQISTFNCGTDAMMTERFRRLCKHAGIPYMLLMVDEHTGRAGVDTRLEAFVDSLAWQRKGAPQ